MPTVIRRGSAALLALLLLVPAAVSAQAPAAVPEATDSARPHPGAPIRWWHVALATGGVFLASAADNSIRDLAQNHNTQTDRDVATAVQRFGSGVVPAAIPAAIIGVGLIAHNPRLTRSGLRVGGSLAVGAVITEVLKEAVGRARPYQGPAVTGFKPFSGRASMPSGHTMAAFALATSLSDEIHRGWATAGLYTLAVGTGASRIVNNAHWFSDVVAGAIIGTTSAKLVNGKWRLFRITPPRILVGPDELGLQWSLGPLRAPSTGGRP
ncbi:MAG TPA: phosphatase PAP2 family protein [Gemmatimonadales bacterium]|nr:phosphatase PAP2 family protein [Gemmatimonadales bacterium]